MYVGGVGAAADSYAPTGSMFEHGTALASRPASALDPDERLRQAPRALRLLPDPASVGTAGPVVPAWERNLARAMAGADLLAVAGALTATFVLAGLHGPVDVATVAISPLMWLGVAYGRGAYAARHVMSGTQAVAGSVRTFAAVLLVLGVLALAGIGPSGALARVGLPAGLAGSCAARLGARAWSVRARRDGSLRVPVAVVVPISSSRGARVLKGALDRCTATLALVLLAPLFLAVAGLVRITSRGPAFYRQTRVGKDGKSFRMVKFRSMYVGAEDLVADLAAHNEAGDGPLFKIREDPRVTPVGRILRRFSIDELPQLINIVSGSM